jgi:hypothetical protein
MSQLRGVVLFSLIASFGLPASAAKRLAPLPGEVVELKSSNHYRYTRKWPRLMRWVGRYYGKESRIEPLVYRNGVPLLTVVSKNKRFGWSHIHFYQIKNQVFISVVPKAETSS